MMFVLIKPMEFERGEGFNVSKETKLPACVTSSIKQKDSQVVLFFTFFLFKKKKVSRGIGIRPIGSYPCFNENHMFFKKIKFYG